MQNKTDVKSKSYCLNLHKRYTPNWSAWECVRELYSNAIDASPDDLRLESPNVNTLKVFTPTVPDIAELLIIGCGSKSLADESIGQFGEGIKLTALVATRGTNSSLIIRLPKETITFTIEPHFGQQVLFAHSTPSSTFKGCLITLQMEGAGYALNGKIIDGTKSQMLDKNINNDIQIFCKGIWINNLQETPSLFSYNLNGLELNRDRSNASPWSVKHEVGMLLLKELNSELAEKLLTHTNTWEVMQCLNAVEYRASRQQKDILANAFTKHFGKKAVLYTDSKASDQARHLGYKPIDCGSSIVQLLTGLTQRDVDVVSSLNTLTPLPVISKEWKTAILELYYLARLLDFNSIKIKVFKDAQSSILGQAKCDTSTIWLNARLFHQDNRFERIRTFFHELAHIHGKGNDSSIAFEQSLDLLGAKLAIEVLK